MCFNVLDGVTDRQTDIDGQTDRWTYRQAGTGVHTLVSCNKLFT